MLLQGKKLKVIACVEASITKGGVGHNVASYVASCVASCIDFLRIPSPLPINQGLITEVIPLDSYPIGNELNLTCEKYGS